MKFGTQQHIFNLKCRLRQKYYQLVLFLLFSTCDIAVN